MTLRSTVLLSMGSGFSAQVWCRRGGYGDHDITESARPVPKHSSDGGIVGHQAASTKYPNLCLAS